MARGQAQLLTVRSKDGVLKEAFQSYWNYPLCILTEGTEIIWYEKAQFDTGVIVNSSTGDTSDLDLVLPNTTRFAQLIEDAITAQDVITVSILEFVAVDNRTHPTAVGSLGEGTNLYPQDDFIPGPNDNAGFNILSNSDIEDVNTGPAPDWWTKRLPDDPSQITELPEGGVLLGRIDGYLQQDWFKTYLRAGVTYTFVVGPSINPQPDTIMVDGQLILFGEDGTILAFNDDADDGVRHFSPEITFTPTASGIYYWAVHKFEPWEWFDNNAVINATYSAHLRIASDNGAPVRNVGAIGPGEEIRVLSRYSGSLIEAGSNALDITARLGSSLNPVGMQVPPRGFSTTLIGSPLRL